MAEYPALPLWTDAYLADTRHLSTMEHGAYLLLLMEAWRRPSCSLPDNDILLARLAGLSGDEWATVKPTVMAFWKYDGRSKEWQQKRLVKERVYVKKKSRSQSDRALIRWNNTKNDDAAAMPDTMPGTMPGVCPDDAPTPTPTPLSKEEDNKQRSSTPPRAKKPPAEEPDKPGPTSDPPPDPTAAPGSCAALDGYAVWELYQQRLAVTGYATNPVPPNPADVAAGQRWLDQGATLALIQLAFDATLARKRQADERPPNRLRYFDGPVAEAMDAGRGGKGRTRAGPITVEQFIAMGKEGRALLTPEVRIPLFKQLTDAQRAEMGIEPRAAAAGGR